MPPSRVLLSDGPLYLIDAHSLMYQVFHALPAMSGPKGQPTNAVYRFVGDMLRLRTKHPDYLICVFDPHGPTFRDELFAEYKAQRDPMPDELRAQIPVIMKAHRSIADSHRPGARLRSRRRPGHHRPTGGGARDRRLRLHQRQGLPGILTDKIKMFNLRKEIVLDEAALLADWGIKPNQVVDLLALTGDAVNNVPGIPGVGIKTAAKLLQEHGTIEGIYAALPTMKKSKVKESLETHRERLAHSRKLVKLVDDMPMSIDWEGWKLQEWDGPAFPAFCEECGCRKFAADVRKLNERQQHSLFDQPTAAEERVGRQVSAHRHAREVRRSPTAVAPQKRFAVDLETTNLNPLQADVVGYAICWQPGTAYYLAVRVPLVHGCSIRMKC